MLEDITFLKPCCFPQIVRISTALFFLFSGKKIEVNFDVSFYLIVAAGESLLLTMDNEKMIIG